VRKLHSEHFSSFLKDSFTYRTIPIEKRFFVDTITPIQLFQSLKDEAAFLLESRDEQSSWSRYSFVGLRPYAYLTEADGDYLLKNRNGDVLLRRNEFRTAFQASVDYLNVKPIETSVPFYGGAVGYVAYDGITELEKVPEHSFDDLGCGRFSFLFCETILALDHKDKELHVFQQIRLTGKESQDEKESLFNQTLKHIDRLMNDIVLNQERENLFLLPGTDDEVDFSNVQSNYSKDRFIEDVERIKNYIRSGDIFQAVLSQRFEIELSASGLDIYRALRVLNPSPYMFYLNIDGIEIVGSSPERLVEVRDRTVEIHPIAGTRKRGKTDQEDRQLADDLIHDEKERAEHFMLVDLARNDVGRVAKYGTVKTPQLMEVGYFSHVMHLVSKVNGELKENLEPIDAMLAAFPAGTVSGAPKIRAMEILQELEPTARNIYAGTIGYLGFDGNIDSCIAIRTMVIKDNTAYVQAGAGIVADSVPENEWEETENKAKALLKAITTAEKIFHSAKVVHNV
jgi:anthranilate synthase component 1